jgi:multimeric flavodoxin WrbA
MEIRVAVAFHSGYGHTLKQAQAVAAGAKEIPNTRVTLLSLDDLSDTFWKTLDSADAIILGSPTYMGACSAAFRKFVEATSGVWADNLRWRNKIAGGFTNSSCMSGDKLQTLVEMAIFAAQHGMIWVGMASFAGWNSSTGSIEDLNRLGSWLGAMAQSNTDQSSELVPPPSDLRTAAALGKRIAEITKVFCHGRAALK